MAVRTISEFVDKATVRVIVRVKNDADALVEPDAVKVSIWDPDGGDPVVDGTDIVVTGKVENGIYEYYYHMDESADAMKSGQWRGQVLVVDGAGVDAVITPSSFSFRVK